MFSPHWQESGYRHPLSYRQYPDTETTGTAGDGPPARKRKVKMPRLLYIVVLMVALAALACDSDAPAEMPAGTTIPPTVVPTVTTQPTAIPRPTATKVPTATASPTASPVPTEYLEPTMVQLATEQVPAEESPGKEIAPLDLGNPGAIMTELTQAELVCASAIAQTDRLLLILANPEVASQEERSELLGCFSEETLIRLFLTGLIGQTAALSVESSRCIRAGFEGIDLRSLMMTQKEGDDPAITVGSQSAMILTLSCLNDDEFVAASLALGMNPEERKGFKCIIEHLGGAESMVAAFGSDGDAALVELLNVSIGCGLKLEGAPSP